MSRAAALGLGMRLALTGGRNARLRTALTAVGVALSVVVLLGAAAIPTVIRAGDERVAGRDPGPVLAGHRGPHRARVATIGTEYHGDGISGTLIKPVTADAPVPPGIDRLPGPGELMVSPALRDLLRHAPLLRERLGGTVVGTIGHPGLRGPRELVYYKGVSTSPFGFQVVDHFGRPYHRDPLPAFLVFFIAVGVVVLLIPVGVFVATAVRFGSEERDRRLAALRLIGADRAMAVRIAAGEALAGALAGLALGAALFVAGRPLVEHVNLEDISVYAGDVRPGAGLTVLIAVLVPAAALVASLVAMRRVVVEPLGVVRQGARARRRLWWRALPMLVGATLLLQMRGNLADGSGGRPVQASAGVLLMLVGLTAVLPWMVEVVLRRMRGGSVAWQLAVRRLQMDGGTAARAVSGVAVAVAGAIALQSLLTVGERATAGYSLLNAPRADLEAQLSSFADRDGVRRALLATRGVQGATAVETVPTDNRGFPVLYVGDCESLAAYAVLRSCRDGETFATPGAPVGRDLRSARHRIAVPADATRVLPRITPHGPPSTPSVLMTPAAAARVVPPHLAGIDVAVRLDHGVTDAGEYARNTFARLDPNAYVNDPHDQPGVTLFRTVRRGIFAGALIVLMLIGASLLVGALEQLRERRPVLAALAAFGTPRHTMTRSVLWQAAIPVALGTAASAAVGVGLGALLLKVASQPAEIDWAAVAQIAGAGAAVILLVSAGSAPALLRMMRPEGLRTE